ncbi:MAG: repair protein, partial [Chloroflexi bacterium]|nr:repair protein [Chloroflexota bacterium]
MAVEPRHTIAFEMQPQLLTKQLGADLYPSPGDALCQLIANCLDADSSRVEITVGRNELGAPTTLALVDDGCGISLRDLQESFRLVGTHVQLREPRRETIGSRGIGRFAVFALAAQSDWDTVALEDGSVKARHQWTVRDGSLRFEVRPEPAEGLPTGTTVRVGLKQTEGIARL